MNAKRKNIALATILLVAGLISCFFIFRTFLINETSHELISNLTEIKKLNDEINRRFDQGTSLSNYDEINHRINHIVRLIEKIESDGAETFAFSSEGKLAIDDLKNTITTKLNLLENYKIIHAQGTDLMIYLSENLEYVSNLKQATRFYTDIILSQIGIDYDEKIFSSDLSKALSLIDDHSSIDFTYLSSISSMAKNSKLLRRKQLEIRTVRVYEKADRVIDLVHDYFGVSIGYALIADIASGLIFVLLFFKFVIAQNEKEKSEERQHRLEQIAYTVPVAIARISKDGAIRYTNAEFESSIGKNCEKLKNGKPEFFDENNRKFNLIKRVRRITKTLKFENITTINKDGELLYLCITATPVVERGEFEGVVVAMEDFTSRHNIQDKLNRSIAQIRRTASVDKITGLPNNIAFFEKIQSAASNGARVIYFSIDQFSNIQFFYGNDVANNVLVEVSNAINLCLETYKINAQLYHLQEDKFCIWYEDNQIAKDTEQIMRYFASKNIRISVANENDINTDLTLTLGISLNYDTAGTDRYTQARLSWQKAAKKERHLEYYTQNDEEERNYRNNQLVSRLIRYALAEDKIIVECQPIFDLRAPTAEGYAIFSHEILVRLLDENNNIHYPGSFLNVAKQASLYLEITKRVLAKTFELLETYPNMRFSTNLSSIDMTSEAIKHEFLERLAVCTHPQNLTIEILESENIENYEEIRKFIRAAQSRGCHVAIDDFGSGYSNFYRLLELNINYLKIDGSIIRKLPIDENAKNIVKTIVTFAKTQKYDIVAEFVAEEKTLQIVQEMDIRFVQGYLLGKPVSPSELKKEGENNES